MVKSTAATVDAWLESLDPERQAVLTRLRDLCRARLTGWEERMQWGMPGYGPPGADARISFNSQKGYVALYVGKATVDAFAGQLAGASLGKGCVRYPRPAAIDFAVVEAILLASFAARQD